MVAVRGLAAAPSSDWSHMHAAFWSNRAVSSHHEDLADQDSWEDERIRLSLSRFFAQGILVQERMATRLAKAPRTQCHDVGRRLILGVWHEQESGRIRLRGACTWAKLCTISAAAAAASVQRSFFCLHAGISHPRIIECLRSSSHIPIDYCRQ